jgi:hypothetical protein
VIIARRSVQPARTRNTQAQDVILLSQARLAWEVKKAGDRDSCRACALVPRGEKPFVNARTSRDKDSRITYAYSAIRFLRVARGRLRYAQGQATASVSHRIKIPTLSAQKDKSGGCLFYKFISQVVQSLLAKLAFLRRVLRRAPTGSNRGLSRL